MKILLISDHEEKALWDHWSGQTAERLSDVNLILSAGDLAADYLEFLVSMLNVPLVYVRGNHDEAYLNDPPEGCIDAEGKIVDVKGARTSEHVRILGLGGSMRYKPNSKCMFTEKEMKRRIAGMSAALLKNTLTGRLKGKNSFDILLTHAPCKGYGDLEDLPHQGFECFNDLLMRQHPLLHVYGHIHLAYCAGNRSSLERTITHPSGTTLINAEGYTIISNVFNLL